MQSHLSKKTIKYTKNTGVEYHKKSVIESILTQ